jgi:hypothetical protein
VVLAQQRKQSRTHSKVGFLLAALVLGSCSSMQRELSDDEWCKRSNTARAPGNSRVPPTDRPATSPSSRSKKDKGRVRPDPASMKAR